MWRVESDKYVVVNFARDMLQSVHVVGQADGLESTRRSGQVCVRWGFRFGCGDVVPGGPSCASMGHKLDIVSYTCIHRTFETY